MRIGIVCDFDRYYWHASYVALLGRHRQSREYAPGECVYMEAIRGILLQGLNTSDMLMQSVWSERQYKVLYGLHKANPAHHLGF